jgi:hypothetical protein
MTEIEQYSNGVRWESGMEEDFDPGSNSSKLFERSRIKALAGKVHHHYLHYWQEILELLTNLKDFQISITLLDWD